MRRLISSLFIIVVLIGIVAYGATGTPSNLVVKTDANNNLLVVGVTQVNPVTQGVFSSRTLRTDSNGNLQVILGGTITPTYPQSIPASTCAAPSLGLSGNPDNGIAFTATPSILNCIEGTAVETITGSTTTSANPYQITNTGSATDSYFRIVGSGDAEDIRFGKESGLNDDAILGVWSNNNVNIYSNSVKRWIISTSGTLSTSTIATLTTDIKLFDTAVTWNNAGVTFTGWKLNVTDTASAAGSLLIDLQLGAGSVFSVRKDGLTTASTSINSPDVNILGAGGRFRSSTNGQHIALPSNGLLNILSNGASFGIQFNTGTAAPTVGTCGTGTITANSRNTTGGFTATGATACTVTFGAPAWTNTPFCTVTLRNAPTTTPYISAISTTAFTVSGLTAGDIIAYHCVGPV